MPAAEAGVEGGTRRRWAAACPAASSAAAHRRGPLPPRGHPRTRPLAVPPSRTPGDRACKSQPGGPPAPGILSPRKLPVKGAPAAHPSAALRADP